MLSPDLRRCCQILSGRSRRFVMLIDSPVFTKLRLQLLSPERYPDLMRAMYSLLMLCPQSRAFHTLHARLSSIPTLALLKLNDAPSAPPADEPEGADGGAVQLPWSEMLQVCRFVDAALACNQGQGAAGASVWCRPALIGHCQGCADVCKLRDGILPYASASQTFKTRQDKLISYSEEHEQRLSHGILSHATPATALSWETASSSSFTGTPNNMRPAQSPVHTLNLASPGPKE
jgi:Vacuolar protein 14 C-terminal Fig4p binding